MNDEAKTEFKMKVMEKKAFRGNSQTVRNVLPNQETFPLGVMRTNAKAKLPEEVKRCEKAAASSEKANERQSLRTQARQTLAKHAVECCLMLEKCNAEHKTPCQSCTLMEGLWRTEQDGKRSCRGIAKMSTTTRR